MNEEVKVSVCVVTYNQEKYIAECLQSLVDQETDFDFEVIVGEDCSTDNTRKVVDKFADKYPDIIVKNYHDKNVGAVENVISTYRLAKGKYICHMDGDDLALPGKLQNQFEILEANPDCIICSHDVFLLKNQTKLKRTFMKVEEGIYSIFDLYKTLPFFAHSSKMFVNDLTEGYWEKLHPETVDIEIHVLQAKKGDIYHLDNTLGVYRLGVGITSETKGVNPLLPASIDRIFKEAALLNKKQSLCFKKNYALAYMRYAYQSGIMGDKKGFKLYLKKSLQIKIFSFRQLVMSVFLISPGFFVFLAKFRDKYRYT